MSVVIESQKQLYDDVDAWCQQAGAGAADAGALDWDVTKVYDFRLLFSPPRPRRWCVPGVAFGLRGHLY